MGLVSAAVIRAGRPEKEETMKGDAMKKPRRANIEVLAHHYAFGKPKIGRAVRIVNDDPSKPVPKDVLASEIREIASAMTKLLASGLNRKAIVALVKDSTGYTKGNIETILDSLSDLERHYCR